MLVSERVHQEVHLRAKRTFQTSASNVQSEHILGMHARPSMHNPKA